MNPRVLVPVLLTGCVVLASCGCAVLSKGRSETVVVQSVPEGAVALVNGLEAGKTPFKINLRRQSTATIELRKAGFQNASVTVLPVANDYAKRYFRWGIDYDLGAMTDLTPNAIDITMLPAIATEDHGDAYDEMARRVAKADEMLASGQITEKDHKAIIGQIIKLPAR